jgi:hypothetical protein
VIICSNARWTWKPRSPLLKGFYGNALILLTAEGTVDELCGRPVHLVEGKDGTGSSKILGMSLSHLLFDLRDKNKG